MPRHVCTRLCHLYLWLFLQILVVSICTISVNIKKKPLHFAHTVYFNVLCGSQNNWDYFPTAY